MRRFPIPEAFRELDGDGLAEALGAMPGIARRLGGRWREWRITEVSDGNMNAVFKVEGAAGILIAKQSLPYIRVIGEGWPFPVDRIEYEHRALEIQARHCPGAVPVIYGYDRDLALIAMEMLSPHIVARKGFVAGVRYPRLAVQLGDYLARSLFFTSDFHLSTPQKKALAAEFEGNSILCETTEEVIFTGPYRDDVALNRFTPGLENIAADFRRDEELKRAAASMKLVFRTSSQALLHGDLHTGSLMLTATETKIIDPEWAFHGPMGFDVGAVIGNLLLAYFSQPGHAGGNDDRRAYADWLLETVEAVWSAFEDGFRTLCREQPGDLVVPQLFDRSAADRFVDGYLRTVLHDTAGFAGAKMIRRIIGISHVEDMETIVDEGRRAACETRALTAARRLLLERSSVKRATDITEIARRASSRA